MYGRFGQNEATIENPLKNELRQRVVLGLSKEWLRGETMRADLLKIDNNVIINNNKIRGIFERIYNSSSRQRRAFLPLWN